MFAVLLFVSLVLSDAAHGGEPMALKITSPSFSHEGEIPKKFSCEGEDVSPELTWSGAPKETKSFVLIVDDPDAPDPDAPKMTWVHWVLYNIPAAATGLKEAAKPSELPPPTQEAINSWGRKKFGGPCPPIGRHRYFHKLYALDVVLEGLAGADKDRLLSAMKGHVIAEAVLMGTYKKAGR
jgi:Raf kinase inhibitor-like YbhB/YbcL family protein